MLTRRLFAWNRVGRVRSFLSSAYECNDHWTAAKESYLVSKVNPDEVFAHIEKRVQAGEPPSAVDVDLLALVAAKRGSHMFELRDALYKLRMSGRAGDLLDSTQYTTIRAHIENDLSSDLLEILDDRLHYGVFLCEFTASTLLNRFLLAGDMASAARVASMLMLQEDFIGPLPESLASYAAYQYVKLVDIPEEIPPPPPPKKKPEPIKVRVRYLRNPFFDDHFDIKDLNHLAGKTLAKAYATSDAPLDLNCKLLGWTFYKKYDKAKAIAERLANGKNLYSDALSIIEKLAAMYEQRNKKEDAEATTVLITYLKTIPTQEVSIEEKMKDRINDAVQSSENSFVEKHAQMFATWESIRRDKLKDQIEKIENAKREAAIKEREEKLKNLEEQIDFFDNEEKVDLQILKNQVFHPKRWFGRKKPPKQTAAEYIPPQVEKRK